MATFKSNSISAITVTLGLLFIANQVQNAATKSAACSGRVWQHISTQTNFSSYTPPIHNNNQNDEENYEDDNYNNTNEYYEYYDEEDFYYNKIFLLFALTDIIGLVWRDERLKWDPELFDNCRYLILPGNLIWQPDITIVNSDDIQLNSRFFNKNLHVQVYPTGLVFWVFYGQLSTTCGLQMTYYPFDFQSCTITFESVSLPPHVLPLTPTGSGSKRKIPMVSSSNNMWIATKTNIENGTSEMGHSYFKLRLDMKRKPQYVLVNVAMPLVLLSVITLLVFFLPDDQKISYCITTFLTFMVLALVIAEHLPESSDNFPLLGVYTILCMIYSVIVTFASAFVVSKSAIEDDVKPTGLLASVLCKVDNFFTRHLRCFKAKSRSKAEYSMDTNVQQNQEHGDGENDVMLSDITTSDERADGTSKPNNNGVQNAIVSDGLDSHDTPTWSHLCNVMDRLFFAFFLLLNLITGLIVFVIVPWAIGFFAMVEEKENINE